MERPLEQAMNEWGRKKELPSGQELHKIRARAKEIMSTLPGEVTHRQAWKDSAEALNVWHANSAIRYAQPLLNSLDKNLINTEIQLLNRKILQNTFPDIETKDIHNLIQKSPTVANILVANIARNNVDKLKGAEYSSEQLFGIFQRISKGKNPEKTLNNFFNNLEAFCNIRPENNPKPLTDMHVAAREHAIELENIENGELNELHKGFSKYQSEKLNKLCETFSKSETLKLIKQISHGQNTKSSLNNLFLNTDAFCARRTEEPDNTLADMWKQHVAAGEIAAQHQKAQTDIIQSVFGVKVGDIASADIARLLVTIHHLTYLNHKNPATFH